jgi:hypothetical protein
MPKPSRKSRKALRAAEAYRRARTGADRVLDRTAMKPVAREYERETGKVVSDLGKLFRGRLGERLHPETLSHTAGWLVGRLKGVAHQVGLVLSQTTRAILTAGYRATSEIVSFVQEAASPLDDIRQMYRVVSGRSREMELLRASSARGMLGDVNATLIDRMSRFPVDEMSISDLVSAVGETLGSEEWKLARLVRTETSYAYNNAQDDAVSALSGEGEFRHVFKRWTEHVDDFTGRPMDGRVGRDSIALHGQVARPGGTFYPPLHYPGAPGTWQQPPNRPNDRAVLTPWLREWGVPGWMMQAGSRLDLST